MGVARYVNLTYVAVGLLAWVVLSEFLGWGLELFGSSANPALLGQNFRLADLIAFGIAGALAVYLRRDTKVHTYAMEVGNELSKVTWPTWAETKLATIVVVIVTLIISLILAAFDALGAALSSFIYNPTV